MRCPNVYTIAADAKFYLECGSELGDPAKAPLDEGIQIGEKTVVAGL